MRQATPLHERPSRSRSRKMQCRLAPWHLWNDPVALREQRLQRPMRYLQRLFLARVAAACAGKVQNVHSECGGRAVQSTRPISPQANDPDRAAVERPAFRGCGQSLPPAHVGGSKGRKWQFARPRSCSMLINPVQRGQCAVPGRASARRHARPHEILARRAARRETVTPAARQAASVDVAQHGRPYL